MSNVSELPDAPATTSTRLTRGPVPAAVGAPARIGVRWRIFALVFALTVVNLVDRTALSVAMPTISDEFSLSPTMQGVILSSFFWSYALLQVPGGWLIDRLGPRAVIGGATLLWGAFQSLAAAATSGATLLLTRIGLGTAEAPMFPAGAKLNSLWLSPRERGRGAVLMDCGGPLGSAIGGLAVAWLIVALDSWRLAFLVAGLATLGLGAFAWRYLRDDPADHPDVDAAELAHIRTADAHLEPPSGARRLGRRSLAGLLLGRASWAMIFFGLLTWGPSYLADARDLDLKQIGAATFVIFLAGALGSLTAGFAADGLQRRGHPRRLVLRSLLGVSGAGTVAGFALLPHVADPVTAIALLAATAFLLLWGSLYWSFPAMLAPRGRVGLVGGVMNFAGSASGIAVPIITGVILDVTGAYLVVLYFFAGCAALYVAGSFLIDFGRRP